MSASIQTLLEKGVTAPSAVTAAMFGMTVYGEIPGTEERIPAILSAALPGCAVAVENDSVAGWGGSLACRPGVNIVGGTGSVAYGRDGTGNGYRVGGWSLFFADEGSCSWIARQMIGEFVKQADGRRPRTAIYEELRRELSLTHDPYFSGYMQTSLRNDSALLARLQLVTLRAAKRGDEAALRIYRRAAEELTEMAVAIRNHLNFSPEEAVPASFSGGLFRAGDTIGAPFRSCMEKNGFRLVRPQYPPVLGALALAAEGFLTRAQTDEMLAAVSKQLRENEPETAKNAPERYAPPPIACLCKKRFPAICITSLRGIVLFAEKLWNW